ncbi:DUF1684 domain-containing protein [Spirosoma sp. 209]|uniref:DUF1684 domain-containing protein n=1 Tax=Spirosoma sp. 209 TaxID=1955701 RepID=UPI00098D6BEB|nr:DUF1684 domain-containing protein [Spirosoma sp. 209]
MTKNESINEPLNPYARWFMLLWLLAVIIASGFRLAKEPTYREQIEEWHQQRLESLRSENGWLNLAGLYWLKEGVNAVGADPGNDLMFPGGKAPDQLGTFRLAGGEVTFEAAPGQVVQVDGQPVLATKTIFAASQTKPVVLSHGSLRWFVIKRGNRYAIRLRDLESPFLKEFTGIERFPVNEVYRVKARVERPDKPRTIPILDITGQTNQQPLIGTLVFELEGKTHRLDAVGEGGRLFLLFGDETNSHDTYGSGRFLYADMPGADGLTTLDFNKSINPPCAFTPYATCPLPPKQNKLAVAIPAGEKRYGDH